MDHLSDVFIVSGVRTPIGCFKSALSSMTAVELGGIAIKGALEKISLDPMEVEEVFMGNVCQANNGQAPARQAALKGGLSITTPATTINKVCASGLKSIMLGAQQLQTKERDLVVCGGMESMSNVPFYIKRGELTYGGFQGIDGIVNDGLSDGITKMHMGECAEKTAEENEITRNDQDEFAALSYQRSTNAWNNGIFKDEIIPITIKDRKGEIIVDKDEEYQKFNPSKMKTLKSAFKKDGTITAANASPLSDGGCAVVLASAKKINELNLKPLAKIITYGDVAVNPINFDQAPTHLIPILLKKSGLKDSDIALYELNEAFSTVPLFAIKKLGINIDKINIHGGAVSLGHPIGMSGARILTHLVYSLKEGQYGCCAICNGGGGASGMIIQKM
ncbi:Acetyl-CoA acetyltransferase, mitochondrial [Strongyloides ratti]|uniref:Acetyl-CoA acetyltransferase, mitochondrial n=1 Tax=Strongyloides ratti TaxID=34506 RepID=A0A090KU54_STRRB|nr:Acetyl-CoA acetyltransferase, mitochondrial [Strongyloides ratti]CEF59395.1 Acetyl-CoA acetyltransferase, mitochondrial [Strongyloides ratti]